MNLCSGDGTLAPARYAIPTDPAVLHWAGSTDVTPCSTVACSACGCAVRSVDNARFDGGPDNVEALYELSDPFQSPEMTTSPQSRVYFCRCSFFDCSASMGLFLRYEVPQLELPKSWTCSGHPTLDLPTEIDGVTVPDTVHWGCLLIATFRRPIDPEDTQRWPLWVERVYGRLAGTPHRGDGGRVQP